LSTDADARRKVAAEAVEAERRQREKEAADARQGQIEVEEARRRKELADAAEAEARRKAEAEAQEKRRIAALEEARRKGEAAVEEKAREERRIAALEEARRTEEKRNAEERLRLAAIPDDDKRAELVRKVQLVLKRSRCWDGTLTGRSTDAQDGLDKLVETARKRGKVKPTRIELAKASVGDFETWLKDVDAVKDGLCVPPKAKSEKAKPVASRGADKARPVEKPAEEVRRAGGADRPARSPAALENCLNQCHAAGGRRSDPRNCNRKCGA
jgi:hypothetical protein